MNYDKYAFLKPVQNGQSEYRHFNWFVHYTLKNSMQSKLAAIHLQSHKTKHVRQLYSAVNRSWCFPINVRIQKYGCWNATARWLRLLPWLLRYGSCSRVVHPTSDVSRQCRGYLPRHTASLSFGRHHLYCSVNRGTCLWSHIRGGHVAALGHYKAVSQLCKLCYHCGCTVLSGIRSGFMHTKYCHLTATATRS